MKVQGRVKWFNAEKGFGFIDRGEGKDVFVHYSQIVQNGYKTLNEGELVEFELYQSERGMQAKRVCMASRKQEIRKEIKKKNAKLGIDVEAAKNIVDLQDQQGEDIHVEDFKNEEYNGEVIPFSTTPQKTKKGFVSKIKGVFDDERKQLKKLDKIAQEIISLEDKYSALSDEELANQTNVLKEKLNNGSELDDILIDAFAVAREAAWR